MAISYEEEVRKLKNSSLEKLNFGCGDCPLEGWTNIDGGDGNIYSAPNADQIIKLDVFQALELIPENSVSFIFSEQFFEHFNRQDGLRLLREWNRILKPDGVLRIQTPDLKMEAMIYLGLVDFADWDRVVLPHRLKHIENSQDTYGKLEEGELYTRAMLINNGMHMDGHLFLYDFETIRQSMHITGFKNIIRVNFGESKHSALDKINLHDGGDTGRSWIPKIVLEVEGQKR